MPLVKIEMLNGKPKEYKKAVFDSVHKALVDAFKIPDTDRMQKIIEYDKENFEVNPNMSENAMMIEITAFSGRSYEAKKKLYELIVTNLEKSPGINPMDVLIVVKESSSGNWGIRGGKAARELDLGYKVSV